MATCVHINVTVHINNQKHMYIQLTANASWYSNTSISFSVIPFLSSSRGVAYAGLDKVEIKLWLDITDQY